MQVMSFWTNLNSHRFSSLLNEFNVWMEIMCAYSRSHTQNKFASKKRHPHLIRNDVTRMYRPEKGHNNVLKVLSVTLRCQLERKYNECTAVNQPSSNLRECLRRRRAMEAIKNPAAVPKELVGSLIEVGDTLHATYVTWYLQQGQRVGREESGRRLFNIMGLTPTRELLQSPSDARDDQSSDLKAIWDLIVFMQRRMERNFCVQIYKWDPFLYC